MKETFTIVRKGYDPSEVQKYVDDLETTIASYRDKDTTIKNAIVNAQIAADNIIAKAKSEAQRIKSESVKFLDSALDEVSAHKSYIASFRREYEAMMYKYTSHFNEDDVASLISDAEQIESYLDDVKASILNEHDID